jgi:hypothetical protein
MKFETIERPGFLGKERDRKFKEWDEKYGKNNWRLAWLWQNEYLDFLGACGVYEEAYFVFLRNNRRILTDLVTSASDVYDDNPSNINSRGNYLIQETVHTHIQDISIRRSVARLGEAFCGPELIQIRDRRGAHPLSMTLSPGRVPFHQPDLIPTPWLTSDWCEPGSVECWYQSARFLQSKKGL